MSACADISEIETDFSQASSHEPEAKCNVTIIYDNVRAGQRAMSILSRILSQERMERHALHSKLWRLDLLEDSDWRELATSDIIESDLLIVAASTQNDPTTSVQNWIRSCLTQKRGGSAAVVALHGLAGNLNKPDSPWIESLESLTSQVGLEFLAPGKL